MEIEYKNSTEDAKAYIQFMTKTSPYLRLQKQRSRFLYSSSIAVFYFAIDSMVQSQIKWSTVIISLLLGVITYLIYPKLSEYSARLSISKLLGENKNIVITGKKKIIIAQEGIQHFSDSGEEKAYWSGVNQLGVTAEHVFIQCSSSIYIIPTSAFSSSEQLSSFIEQFKSFYHDSTGKTLPVVTK